MLVRLFCDVIAFMYLACNIIAKIVTQTNKLVIKDKWPRTRVWALLENMTVADDIVINKVNVKLADGNFNIYIQVSIQC